MKKVNLFLVPILAISFAITSCKKEKAQPQTDPEKTNISIDYAYQTEFSKALAKAVKEQPDLRTFIKNEALKQFDKDYDILFQAVKDVKVNNEGTFYDILMKYADQKEVFQQACDKLPLLTIFVPELPNFSAETWNANSAIPVVAVKPDDNLKSGEISIYDAAGKEDRLAPGLIPGFPVLVVKTNERVVLSSAKQSDKGSNYRIVESQTQTFFSNNKFSFTFLDNTFNGLADNSHTNTRTGMNQPALNIYTIDKINVDAYTSGSEWHRDFVYYGITPSNPNGRFTNRFSEYITSFKLLNGNDLNVISDQTNDPQPDKLRKLSDPQWTEGRFEFRISIFINGKNGVGNELRKAFTASGADLFDLTYKPIKGPIGNLVVYILTSVTPKAFNPNIEITSWDLEQYGSAWKFAITEYDPTEEFTRTITHSSEYGTNFGIDIGTGEKIKVGAKFGISSTTTNSIAYQYKITTGSDDLAEGILDFRSPVITSLTGSPASQRYTTYEVTTGMVSLAVEPKRVY
jgi:hypothetical protein